MNESSLGGKSLLLAAGIDFGVEAVECNAQWGCLGRGLGHDLGEFGAQQAGVGSGKKQRDSEAIGCELITVAMRDAFDDAVQAESPKVIGHPSDGVVGWIEAQQLRQHRAHFPIVEPAQLETEYNQDSEQSLRPLVAKAQG